MEPVIDIKIGDCREVLKTLPDKSVHCVVTSPPYWGLRDYGVEGQLGLEKTPEEYVTNLVEIFREVKRVLRYDGTVWLNLGDCYAGGGRGGNPDESEYRKQATNIGSLISPSPVPCGLKPKDLVGIPWRVAFALQADGWWLRSDIVWMKPNPMPESVRDRPTRSHEFIFLLTKSKRYYYDADAIREKDNKPKEWKHIPESKEYNTGTPMDGGAANTANPQTSKGIHRQEGGVYHPCGRNKRDVWTITTKPYTEAHFATFPPDLIEPCIKAGTSERGCCAICGTPHIRIVEKKNTSTGTDTEGKRRQRDPSMAMRRPPEPGQPGAFYSGRTIGWGATCSCSADITPCVVLDPFGGSGTTGMVAKRLGRSAILIELNEDYKPLIEKRIMMGRAEKRTLLSFEGS